MRGDIIAEYYFEKNGGENLIIIENGKAKLLKNIPLYKLNEVINFEPVKLYIVKNYISFLKFLELEFTLNFDFENYNIEKPYMMWVDLIIDYKLTTIFTSKEKIRVEMDKIRFNTFKEIHFLHYNLITYDLPYLVKKYINDNRLFDYQREEMFKYIDNYPEKFV
jgi:hypothetical protein